MVDAVKSLLDNFSHQDRDAGRRLAALLREDEEAFQQAVVQYLANGGDLQSARLVIWLLQREGKLLEILLNENLSSLEEAVCSARVTKQVVDQLDVHLARTLKGAPDDLAFRILRLLAEVCDSNRTLPLLIRTLREESSELRAKAAFIFARYCQNNLFLEHAMRDPEAEVRAKAIEGLSLSEYPADASILADASADEDPGVQACALLAQYRHKDGPKALRKLGDMARHQQASFRAKAAWALGEIGNRRAIRILEALREDSDAGVRRQVEEILGRAESSAAQSPQSGEAGEDQGLVVKALSATLNERGNRSIYVSVIEGNDRPLADLEERDFRVEEAGQTMRCRVTDPSTREPLSLAWVLDCSGSMSAPKIREMTAAVVKSIEQKGPEDRMAVYKYSFDVQGASKLTHNPKRLAAVIRRPFTGAKTASRLHDALWQALENIVPERGYRAVLAVADSGDQGSEHTFSAVIGQFRKAGVPLYVIGFSKGTASRELAELGEQAGGKFLCAKDGTELNNACRSLLMQLANHYCLSYYRDDKPAGAARVVVEIPGEIAETTADLIAI